MLREAGVGAVRSATANYISHWVMLSIFKSDVRLVAIAKHHVVFSVELQFDESSMMS